MLIRLGLSLEFEVRSLKLKVQSLKSEVQSLELDKRMARTVPCVCQGVRHRHDGIGVMRNL